MSLSVIKAPLNKDVWGRIQVELNTCLNLGTTFRRGGVFTSRHGTARGGLGWPTHGLVAAQDKDINFPCPSREWNLDPLVAVWHLYAATLRCTFQYRAETRCYRSKQRTREGRLQAHNEFCLYQETHYLAVYYQWQRLAGWRNESKIYSRHGDRNVYRLAALTENLLSVNGVGWTVIYNENSFTWTKIQSALLVQWRQ